jgi:predicted nucleotidyltransferase
VIDMLTHEQIQKAANQVVKRYPLTKVSYFGSYATEESDLDLLVEFTTPAVSLIDIIGVKYDFEDILHIPVDVIHTPIPKSSLIKIDKEIKVYG